MSGKPTVKDIGGGDLGMVTASVSAFSAPDSNKTTVVGNTLAPTDATVAEIINVSASLGYTQLILKFKRDDGAGATQSPILYFALNAADGSAALATTTDNRFIALGDEVSFVFSADDPLTSVHIKPDGTMTNTIVGWEYR